MSAAPMLTSMGFFQFHTQQTNSN